MRATGYGILVHSSGVLIAVGDDKTIIRSCDSGATWKKVDVPHISGLGESEGISLRSIAEYPGTHELFAVGAADFKYSRTQWQLGVNGKTVPGRSSTQIEKWTAILSSLDTGKTWRLAAKIDNAALYWPFFFSDGKCLLQGYADSVYEYAHNRIHGAMPTTLTADSKKEEILLPLGSALLLCGDSRRMIRYNEKLFVLEDAHTIGVSADRGASWATVLSGENHPGVNGVAVLDERTLVAACENGILLFTKDAGKTWTSREIAGENLNDIATGADPHWWAAGDNGFIGHSDDAGNSWARIPSDFSGDLLRIIIEPGGQVGWALGKKGKLVHVYNERTEKGFSQATGADSDTSLIGDRKKSSWNNVVEAARADWYTPADTGDDIPQGLLLTLSPRSVSVKIDGHAYTAGDSLKIPLPTGKHFVSLTKKGYLPREDSVEVGLGKVEEKDFSLHRIRVFVSPSIGIQGGTSGFGALFHVQAGTIGSGRNWVGLGFDGGFASDSITYYDLNVIAGHRFEPARKFFVTPVVGAGIMLQKVMPDSAHADSAGLRSGGKKDTAQYVKPTARIGLDFQFRKNDRWGLTLEPDVVWAQRMGFILVIRFGVVIWIL